VSQSGSGGSSEGRLGEQSLPETIDQYTVTRRIGRGGQGEVLLGHDPNLDIDVAIKILHADYRTEEFLDRFKVEARTSVRLTAPNIVRVYAFNPAYPYLVMEYCADGDLTRMIKSRRPLPLRRSLEIVRQVAQALIAAHEHDPPILHRDLKPGNVLFQKDVPKVADFGLAKMLGATTGLTTTRGMMGTVGYASPEQLKDASKVDHRTDLWSVGVILYELLTFRRPFQKPGDDYVNVAIKVRMEPPAPPPFELPGPVWELITRGLQKEPENRFGSAAEIVQAIDDVLSSLGAAADMELPPPESITEVERMAAQAAILIDEGSTQNAASIVSKMRKVDPEASLPGYWSKQLREAREQEAVSGSGSTVASDEFKEASWLERQLHAIKGLLEKREFKAARRRVGELLMQDPDNTVVQKYIQRINDEEAELSQMLNEAHETVEKARAAQDYQKVHEIWQKVESRFPGIADVQAQLAVAARELHVQKLRTLRAGTERAAQRLRDMGDLAGAIATWDTHIGANPNDTEALSERDALVQERRAKERAARLETVTREAQCLREAGELDEALAAWEALLAAEPGLDEATRNSEELRREILLRGQSESYEQATSDAQRALEAGDQREAVAVWKRFCREFPDHAKGGEHLRTVEHDLAEKEKAVTVEEIDRQVSNLDVRLRGGRYKSLPEARARVASALESASTAEAGSAVALEALRTATREAEEILARALAASRAELGDLVDQAAELVAAATDPDADAGAERGLETAAGQALVALGAALSGSPEGDPLAAVSGATARLKSELDRLAQALGDAVAIARKRAEVAISEAREAVAPLAPAEGRPIDGKLARLSEDCASGSTARLDAVAQEAASLGARAESARLAGLWQAASDLGGLRDEALELLRHSPEARLQEIVRETSATLDSLGDDPTASPEGIAAVCEQLGGELSAVRERQTAGLSEARSRWESAVESWSGGPAGEARPEVGSRVEALKKSAEQSLNAADGASLERLAAELSGLARRVTFETSWSSWQPAAAALEGERGQDKLLARFRQAVAEGSQSAVESAGKELERQLRETEKAGGGQRRAALPEIPEVDGRTRAFNERYAPVALERFERAATEYGRARKDGDPAGQSRLGAEMEKAHERLLLPPSSRPTVVAAAAAAVLTIAILGGTFWSVSRTAMAAVTLVSAAGEIEVVEVSRNGSKIDSLTRTTVGEEGVSWDLEGGSYVLRTESSEEVVFQVPETRSVVLGRGRDHSAELMRELDLDDAIDSGDL
jgi:serine/threonine protein kinase